MVEDLVNHLVVRLQTLELHAAHSGREVTHVLVTCAQNSKATDIRSLMSEIKKVCEKILPVIPPYAPPLNSMNRVLLILENGEASNQSLDEVKNALSKLSGLTELADVHGQIAAHIMSVLPDKASIYTHTLSETLLGVLIALHKGERLDQVFVTESRPNNDGWITAHKLVEAGVKTQLTLDMAYPVAIDQADVMLSGTEMIVPSGSVVCKVGVYPASIYSELTSKPVYIIADTGKICSFETDQIEMTPVSLKEMGMEIAPDGLDPFGSYFDVTPAKYIHGYVTEKGILNLEKIKSYVHNQPVSQWLASVI